MIADRSGFWKHEKACGLEKYVDSVLCPRDISYADLTESMLEYKIIPHFQWDLIDAPDGRSFLTEWSDLGEGMRREPVTKQYWDRAQSCLKSYTYLQDDQQTFRRDCGRVCEKAIQRRLQGQSLTLEYLKARLTDECRADKRYLEHPEEWRIAAAPLLLKPIIMQGCDMFNRLGSPHSWGELVSAGTDTVTSGKLDVMITTKHGEVLCDLKTTMHYGSFHPDSGAHGVSASPKNSVQLELYALLISADETQTVPRFLMLLNPLLGCYEQLDLRAARDDHEFMDILEHLAFRALSLDDERLETAMQRVRTL